MTPFTSDQWIIVALVFLLGIVVGLMLMAGGKWKRRYKDETRRASEIEAENKRLRKEAAEMDSLRHAAAKEEARRHGDAPGPL